MEQPSLSIIIPTYNRASLLATLLEQLANQTAPAHQIIVVDDHSTDTTARVVQNLVRKYPSIVYVLNRGHHQRDGKKTGLSIATGQYIGFFDDDALVEDRRFLEKLAKCLQPNTIVQAKIILEQMGKRNLPTITWKDRLATRPYPILELITTNLNRGSARRAIFPLIEWGNFWHCSLKDYFIDNNLIKDAYGESYAASLKLRRKGIKLQLEPSLVIRHPGAAAGGSHKFNKKAMTCDFTEFHYGYFYNIIYLHARFFPYWIWLWLPFYIAKSIIALAINKNLTGWCKYAIKPTVHSLAKYLSASSTTQSSNQIFIWQGGWQGGAERVTLEAGKYFQAQGARVALGVYQLDQAVALPQLVIHVPGIIPISFRSLYASLVFRVRHADQFMIVYTHTVGAWKTKTNHLFVHEAADLDAYQADLKRPLIKLAALTWRLLYLNLTLKRATKVFAATEQTKNYCLRHGVPAGHITSSASFYNDQVFHFIRRSAPIAPYHLVFVGNYQDKRKNFAQVRRFFYSNQQFRVTILGGAVQKQTLNFSFLGYRTEMQVQAALAAADLFLMPSQSEGFSVALLEALATGIPCLVNQTAVNPEIEDIVNLIPYAPNSNLTKAALDIMQNYTRYNRHDSRLQKFARPVVLQGEFNHLSSYIKN